MNLRQVRNHELVVGDWILCEPVKTKEHAFSPPAQVMSITTLEGRPLIHVQEDGKATKPLQQRPLLAGPRKAVEHAYRRANEVVIRHNKEHHFMVVRHQRETEALFKELIGK